MQGAWVSISCPRTLRHARPGESNQPSFDNKAQGSTPEPQPLLSTAGDGSKPESDEDLMLNYADFF